jgi:hypothetical protein
MTLNVDGINPDEIELKLQCLRLGGGRPASEMIEIAEEAYKFVKRIEHKEKEL